MNVQDVYEYALKQIRYLQFWMVDTLSHYSLLSNHVWILNWSCRY